MENYITLFNLLSLDTIQKITGMLDLPVHLSKPELIDVLEKYVDENGGYNVEPLDTSITEVLNLHISDLIYLGINSEWGEVSGPKFYSKEDQKLYDKWSGPNKWDVELSINGRSFRTDITLGGGHKEKLVKLPKRVQTKPGLFSNHVWVDHKEYFNVRTIHDFDQFVGRYEGNRGQKPQYRNKHPKALEVLDLLLFDVSFAEYTIEEYFDIFPSGSSYEDFKKLENSYHAIQKIKRQLESILR